MQCYVGLDVSLKQTSICVVDQTGLVVLPIRRRFQFTCGQRRRMQYASASRLERRPRGCGPSLSDLACR